MKPLSWAPMSTALLAPKAVGSVLKESLWGGPQAECLPCSQIKRQMAPESAFVTWGVSTGLRLGNHPVSRPGCIAVYANCLLLPWQKWDQGLCLRKRGQVHPMPQQASLAVAAQDQSSALCSSTVLHLLLSWGPSPMKGSKGLGSAFTAERQKHICDLFLVLIRLPCMESFRFRFLFSKMRLMIVSQGLLRQGKGNSTDACKILQKTAWGWARVISLISCTLT